MGMLPFNESGALIVDKVMGKAYDVVKAVYDNLAIIVAANAAIPQMTAFGAELEAANQVVLDIQTGRDLATSETAAHIVSLGSAKDTHLASITSAGAAELVAIDAQGDILLTAANGYAVAASNAATLSQSWATGTLPGGVGTKSAREWSVEAQGHSLTASDFATIASDAATVAGESSSFAMLMSRYKATIAEGMAAYAIGEAFTSGEGGIMRAYLKTGAATYTVSAVGEPGPSGASTWAAITDKPATFAPSAHSHVIADVTGLQAALDGKTTTGYVDAAVAGLVDASPATLNTLNELAAALGDDPNFATTVSTLIGTKLDSSAFIWANLGGKPATFAPSAHAHVISDVTGLQTALDGKQSTTATKTALVNALTTTTSPWAWNSDNYDQMSFSALANALTINADAGTPTDGKKMILRIKDNGTARALTWTTGTAKSFRAVGVTLPTTTVLNKTLYIGCVYNGADSRWDVVAVAQEA